MDINTGIKIGSFYQDEIRVGDVLKSSVTFDVIVMWHADKNIFIAKKIGDNEIYFSLEEFVKGWEKHLKIDNNINEYNDSQIMNNIDYISYLMLLIGLFFPMCLVYIGLSLNFNYLKALYLCLLIYSGLYILGILMFNYLETGNIFKLAKRL